MSKGYILCIPRYMDYVYINELSLFELRFTLPLTVHQLINPATLSQSGKSKYSANMGYGCIKQVLITMNGTGEIFVL